MSHALLLDRNKFCGSVVVRPLGIVMQNWSFSAAKLTVEAANYR
jgi:hypothetical protein